MLFVSELNAKDPELDRAINVGFPLGKNSGDRSNDAKKLQQWIKSKTSLESAARLRHCRFYSMWLLGYYHQG